MEKKYVVKAFIGNNYPYEWGGDVSVASSPNEVQIFDSIKDAEYWIEMRRGYFLIETIYINF